MRRRGKSTINCSAPPGKAQVFKLEDVDRVDQSGGSDGAPPGLPASHYLKTSSAIGEVAVTELFGEGTEYVLYSVEDVYTANPKLVFLALPSYSRSAMWLTEAFIDRGIRKQVMIGAKVAVTSLASVEKVLADPMTKLCSGEWSLSFVWNTGRCGSTLLHKAISSLGVVSLSEPHWLDQLQYASLAPLHLGCTSPRTAPDHPCNLSGSQVPAAHAGEGRGAQACAERVRGGGGDDRPAAEANRRLEHRDQDQLQPQGGRSRGHRARRRRCLPARSPRLHVPCVPQGGRVLHGCGQARPPKLQKTAQLHPQAHSLLRTLPRPFAGLKFSAGLPLALQLMWRIFGTSALRSRPATSTSLGHLDVGLAQLSSLPVAELTARWIGVIATWVELQERRRAGASSLSLVGDPIGSALNVRMDEFTSKDMAVRTSVLRSVLSHFGLVATNAKEPALAPALKAFETNSQVGSSMSGEKVKIVQKADVPAIARCVQLGLASSVKAHGVIVEQDGANVLLPRSLGVPPRA